MRRFLLCAHLMGTLALWSACETATPARSPAPPVAKAAPEDSARALHWPRWLWQPTPQAVDEAIYFQRIRPMLAARGCDAQPCHGMPKGGGLFLAGGNQSKANFTHVLAQIDRQTPRASKLYRKAVGLEPHNGGRNIDAQSCDGQSLLAWLEGSPLPACDPPARASELEQFVHHVMPALRQLGCSAAACHGAGNADKSAARARARLDLSAIANARDAEKLLAAFQKTGLLPVTPWMSPVLKAARGEGAAVHTNVAGLSCAYAALYRFVALAPPAAGPCSDAPPAQAQRQQRIDDFGRAIASTLVRRGCTDTSCHGDGAGDLSLFEPVDPHAQFHNVIVLSARLDASDPNASLLLRTARNEVAHGGGKRLGGHGDCRDDMLVAWAKGAPVTPCPQRKAPSKARFAAEVQPVLERMTCTRAACHGRGQRKFFVVAKPDRATLERNYQQTLAEIDLEFTPLSGVMLRMREPCAYATVAAWIENQPTPDCVARDPDPAIFPRIDDGHSDAEAHPL